MRAVVLGLLVSLCPGCGGDDDGGGGGADASPDPDGGDGDTPDAGGDLGTGLTVHISGLVSDTETWIMLGDDGARRAHLESTTDASFPDVHLPVDVHHLQVGEAGQLNVTSYLAIDVHEIWIDGAGGPPCLALHDADVSGTITTELAGGGSIEAGADGADTLDGTDSWSGDTGGAYGMTVDGCVDSDTVDVVAWQQDDDGHALRVGAARDVDVSGGSATGVDIDVDHVVDQTLDVTVTGDEPYGGAYKAQLVFQRSRSILFFTEDEDLPIAVPTPEMDTPMQALDRYVWVPLGEGDGYDFGPLESARMYVRAEPAATSLSIAALSPFVLGQPAFAGEEAEPTVVAAGDLAEITWTADPDADQVELMIQAFDDENAYEDLQWHVFAPAALGKATVPDLPDAIFDGPFLAARPYVLYMTQADAIGSDVTSDQWSVPGGRSFTESRLTRRRSFFTIE